VYCVGKNYLAHVVEMGGDATQTQAQTRGATPVFFTKPGPDGIVCAGNRSSNSNSSSNRSSNRSTPIEYPPNTTNLHYEVELVVAIGNGNESNTNNSNTDLLDCVYGYAVGIDLTRRDLQDEAKSKRWPWDTAKYFDQSAPVGPITPRTPKLSSSSSSSSPPIQEELDPTTMALTVNGETRQSVTLDQMVWKVPEIVSELSKSFRLKPGDLIMTGTPSGVGPVVRGDRLIGTIDGLVEPVDITLV